MDNSTTNKKINQHPCFTSIQSMIRSRIFYTQKNALRDVDLFSMSGCTTDVKVHNGIRLQTELPLVGEYYTL